MTRFFRVTVISISLLVLAACSGTPESSTEQAAPTATHESESDLEVTSTEQTAPAMPDNVVQYGYTYNQADGNRYVTGQGQITTTDPIDIELPTEPVWLVSAAHPDGGSVWGAALADGLVRVYWVTPDSVTPIEAATQQLESGEPPLLRVSAEGDIRIIEPPADASALTHPVILTDGMLVYIADSGEIVFTKDGADVERLDIDAMLDGRLVQDETGRLLVLARPTTSYGHGVLGNDIEAESIILLETTPEIQIVTEIDEFDGSVIEGTAPIWADINGDGQREIIVTLADRQRGARITAFNEDGTIVAESNSIGQGFRWRHQLAVAPFDGPPQLVDVLTPHLGRTVEFFAVEGDFLNVTAAVNGYTSHGIGSPNLDTAVAGDFDGDGQVELLLPNASFSALAGIVKSGEEATVAYELETEGAITTNLSAVLTNDGLQVGVGLADDRLRIWP